MLMPTQDAVQKFEREQATSHIKNNIPEWATQGYQKALDYVNDWTLLEFCLHNGHIRHLAQAHATLTWPQY